MTVTRDTQPGLQPEQERDGSVAAREPAGTIGDRKDDHLRIAAERSSLHERTAGFRAWRLRHRALPERDLEDVDLATSLLGARLRAPLLISSMTGGTERAAIVNRRLAEAATLHGVGMGLGSGRVLLADPSLLATFVTGPRPPLLLANLGAVQLRRGVGPDDAERLVDLTGADGLILHLNAVQEAVQPEGDTTFGGVVERIGAVIERLAPRPVVVKEVGFGIGPADLELLAPLRPAAIDLAGAGGTNWALVEGQRDEAARDVAVAFRDWGWPTAQLLDQLRDPAAAADVPLIASGGVSDGVEAAIAVALGATAVGIARPYLVAALEDRAGAALATTIAQLRIAVWATGVRTPRELATRDLVSA